MKIKSKEKKIGNSYPRNSETKKIEDTSEVSVSVVLGSEKLAISANNFNLGLSDAEKIDELILGKPEVKYLMMNEIIEPDVAMRDEIDRNKLRGLADSIKKIGLINPITVTKSYDKYEIIAGQRRYLAHKMLVREKILCYIMASDGVEIIQRRYAENMERSDVEPWEEGRYLLHLQQKYSLTQQEVAHSIGKSVGYVNERIAVIQYNGQLLKALKEKMIDFSVARELNKVESEEKMLEMLNYAVKGGCNARTMRQWREDINIDIQTQAKQGEEKAHMGGEGYEKPEELFITCNFCQRRVPLLKTILLRACKDCYEDIIK
jgi:ParB family chromosome partitioning protein